MGMQDAIKAAVNQNAPMVSSEDSLRTAIQTLTDARTTGLVVKVGTEVAGVITTIDLMRSLARKDDLDQTKVMQFMTACEMINRGAAKVPCVQVDENETVGMALSIMDEAGVNNLLVSGPDGQAIGMVSSDDLLRLAIS